MLTFNFAGYFYSVWDFFYFQNCISRFAKRNKKADGGMIKQAQQNYRGSYISGDLGGVEVSNPSLRKYYKGML